jgi:hypothetical protein
MVDAAGLFQLVILIKQRRTVRPTDRPNSPARSSKNVERRWMGGVFAS